MITNQQVDIKLWRVKTSGPVLTHCTVVDGLYRAARINQSPQLVAERGYDAMSVLSPC